MEDSEVIAVVDQKLDERFHKLVLHLERLDKDVKYADFRYKLLEHKIEEIKDEITLPSGAVAQGFSSLQKRLEHSGAERETSRNVKKRSRISNR